MITEPRKINVLGTEINIVFRKESDDKKLEDSSGYFDFSDNFIVIKIIEPDENSVSDLEKFQKDTIRHEIIHAFLYHSGLWCSSSPSDAWATNEEMVDWFTMQSPKIFKLFQEQGLI